MPIYEYVCEKCGHHLEIMQKMDDKPLTRCPKCKGKLDKIFSQTSFQFKGSGWYVSDYGKTGGGKKDKDKKDKEGGSEEKKETKEKAAA
ncbi:MAG TPA: FmdB family zinc ribbon protein [Blastocatellia bacterium]|nr:FmdB family zinc ribbon protein [Blastocatellia bacterium]